MDAIFNRLERSAPLAVAAMEVLAFVFRPELLDPLYDRHRGRCYTGELTFPDLMHMLSVALLQHGGSGHRQYALAERSDSSSGAPPVDSSNFYKKLAKMPVEVSRALLRDGTSELTSLVPDAMGRALPACFDGMEPIVIDGKKIKHVAHRLAPTRGFKGALLGAKVLVALSLRQGLALAMSDSLDGEANDIPLVPGLLPQVREKVDRPILWLADRQFGTPSTARQFQARDADPARRKSPGGTDHFLVRISSQRAFVSEGQAIVSADASGRRVVDEQGRFGTGTKALRVRRITLERDDEDVVLVTDLLDASAFPASDLLALYAMRWGIEQIFQQVTQTFSLKHVIGHSPRAVILQMAVCLLLYNVTHVTKSYLAADGKVDRERVSTFETFDEMRRGMTTWLTLGLAAPIMRSSSGEMSERLRKLLLGRWHASYLKRSDKRPRPPKSKRSLEGGHSSVHRLMTGKVVVGKAGRS